MKKRILIGSLILLNINTITIDDLHFYRAQPFFGEPRLEKAWLGSLDFTVGAGSTNHARNEQGKKTELLNIYGPHNMHLLGSGVPKNSNDQTSIILTNLARLPASNCFGQLLYSGHFKITEATASYIQNFTRGFFAGIFLPIISMEITDVCYTDLSSCSDSCPNRETPQWQAFLNSFQTILQAYNLYAGPVKKHGLGDTILYGGWSTNYQDTQVIDYIDATIKLGAIIPTSPKKNENNVFEIPLGYEGHSGVILCASGSFGTYDWLTIGSALEALFFFDKQKDLHMKTDYHQNGFIKLAHGTVQEHKGPLWRLGGYTRADHLVRGLSFLIGYSYTQQNKNTLSPCDTMLFNCAVVNSDNLLKGWRMHTLHWGADYDFTKENMKYGPRVGAYYDLQVGGKRTFNTSMGGGTIGVDIAYIF